MRKATDTKLTWIAINPESLPAEHRKAYDALRKCFDATKKAKQAFEAHMVATIKGATSYPETHPLKSVNVGLNAGNGAKFSYLRGIAVAVAPAESDKATRDAASLVA